MNSFKSHFSEYKDVLPEGLLLPNVTIDSSFYKEIGLDYEKSSSYDFLLARCKKGMEEKGINKLPNLKEYEDRLRHELSLFKELNFCDYILLVWDVLNFCKLKGIPTGLGRGCLTGESKVTTTKGIKDIKNVVPKSDIVVDRNGIQREVSAVFEHGYHDDLIKIITSMSSNDIAKFTKDHKILTLPYGSDFSSDLLVWKQASEIKKGDYLVRAIEKRIFNVSQIDLADFCDPKCHEVFDDYIIEKRTLNGKSKKGLSRRYIKDKTGISFGTISMYINSPEKCFSRTRTILDNFFKAENLSVDMFKETKLVRKYNRYIKVDDDFCYLIGYYIGDGWVQPTYTSLIFHDTDNILELNKIRTYLKTIVDEKDIYENNRKDKSVVELNINCKLLANFFKKTFTHGAYSKRIPAIFEYLPNHKAKYLLEGLVASDGSVEKGTARTKYTSICMDLIYQVRSLAERLGHICYIVKRDAKTFYERDSYCVCWNTEPATNYSFGNNNGKHVFVRVKDIIIEENKNGCKVYDLCIEEEPSFHTNSFIVHNSAAGSLALYLCDITGIDPIKHNLFFERFVSKARAKQFEKNGVTYLDGSLMCDIDNDISYERRQEVIDYLYSKYPENVAAIMTFTTLSGKLCVKECVKILDEVSEEEANMIADSIPKVFGKVMSLEDASEKSDKFKEWVEKSSETFRVARSLEGLIKNTSVHPSGLAISKQPVADIVPLTYSDGTAIASYDMDYISLLMLKVDILGLRTLSVVDNTCKILGIDWKKIDINHESIYTSLQNLKSPKGIFQIEADATWEVCKKIKPQNINELSDVIALSRPGAMAFVDSYVDVKNGNTFIEKRHPELDKILEQTKGTIIYQEQLLAIADKVFNLSLEDGEQIRRACGKKKPQEMKKWESKIRTKANKLGLENKLTDFYWDNLLASADYSFNKSHSVSYAYLSAITLYLKANHPKEFFLALLQSSKFEPKPHEEIRIISGELKHFGIELLPPDLGRSEVDFSIDGPNIRYGLSSIKGIASKSLESLRNFRESKFPSKYDIFISAKSAGLNIGALSSLIQAGTLTGYQQKRSRLVLEAQVFNVLTDREKRHMVTLGAKYNYDLLTCIKDCVDNKLIGDDSKVIFNERRFETLKKKIGLYKQIYKQNSKYESFANWYFENKLLGYSSNLRLKNILEGDYFDSEDLPNLNQGQKVKFCGIVLMSKKGKSRNGNAYLMLKLYDENGVFQALLCDNQRYKKFTEYIEDKKPIPEKDDIVTILASISDDKTLFIEELSILSETIYMKLSDVPDDPEPLPSQPSSPTTS